MRGGGEKERGGGRKRKWRRVWERRRVGKELETKQGIIWGFGKLFSLFKSLSGGPLRFGWWTEALTNETFQLKMSPYAGRQLQSSHNQLVVTETINTQTLYIHYLGSPLSPFSFTRISTACSTLTELSEAMDLTIWRHNQSHTHSSSIKSSEAWKSWLLYALTLFLEFFMLFSA